MTALSSARKAPVYPVNLHAPGLLFSSFPPAGCFLICTDTYFPIFLLLLESLCTALCFDSVCGV